MSDHIFMGSSFPDGAAIGRLALLTEDARQFRVEDHSMTMR